MTTAICGMTAIAAVVITGVLGALWQERCEKRAAEASRTAPATAHGPVALASLPLPVPALERDGEPLSEQETADYIGCLFASNRVISEPTYGGQS